MGTAPIWPFSHEPRGILAWPVAATMKSQLVAGPLLIAFADLPARNAASELLRPYFRVELLAANQACTEVGHRSSELVIWVVGCLDLIIERGRVYKIRAHADKLDA